MKRRGHGASDPKHPDDVFEGPGFTMKRYGRFVEMASHRSPQEQAALMQQIWGSRQQLLKEIRTATDELVRLLHKYTSLDLLANIWLRNGVHDPNEYVEWKSPLRPHFIEHLAMLQLKDTDFSFQQPVLVDWADVERCQKLLTKIFEHTIKYYSAESANPQRGTSPPDAIDSLRFMTLTREIAVGPPSYYYHWKDVLCGLFGVATIATELRQTLGIELSGTLDFIDAIEAEMDQRVKERITLSKSKGEAIAKQLAQYMNSRKYEGLPEHKELFDRIRSMPSKHRKRYVKTAFREWARVGLSTTISFTADVLAKRTNRPVEEAAAFLAIFSLDFGTTEADYFLPRNSPAIRTHPLIRSNHGYMCPIPGRLLWAVKPVFEEALKTKNTYQKHRANFLVHQGLEHLKRILPGCECYECIFYEFATNQQAELDGLIIYDRYAFLVEGKAGSFDRARRGEPGAIKRKLEDLVAEPAKQAARARDYIRNQQTPRFQTREGNELAFDKNRITEIELITLTLEGLDVYTADLHQIQEIGLIEGRDLPWAVCLTDLRVIAETFRFPSEFIYYLKWRRIINQEGLASVGMDELNWVGIYLNEGPLPPRPPSELDFISFTSYTEEFDAYFDFTTGVRTKPAKCPSQPIPYPMIEIFQELHSSARRGFTAPAEFLLELPFGEREQFGHDLSRLAMRAKRGILDPIRFEGERLAIILHSKQQSVEVLQQSTEEFSRSSGKPVLGLGIQSIPCWRVLSWYIADSTSSSAF